MKRWLEEELPFREIVDVGIRSYDEFACSRSTFSWMQRIGWPTDATLQIVDVCVNDRNVIVKAWPKEEPSETRR